MEKTFENKRIIPSELYDVLFEYIALNAAKQSLMWIPDYVRDTHTDEFDYTVKTYPKEVNVRLKDLSARIDGYNISPELRSHIGEILHDDLLAVQQIAMLKTTSERSEI